MNPMLMRISMLLLTPAIATAAVTFTLLEDGDALNHWPGADGWVMTGDDVISAALSPMNASAPNPGVFSYNAFSFGSGVTDTGMPLGFDAITFISGSASVDLTVAGGDLGLEPLFTAMTVSSGTKPFPAHADFSAQFTNISGGSYDRASGLMTLECDFEANLNGNVDESLGMTLGGFAWVVEEADYATWNGGLAYVSDVLIPLAQARGAKRLLYARAAGVTPIAENGSWGQMPIDACLVGLNFTQVPAEQSTWSAVKSMFADR